MNNWPFGDLRPFSYGLIMADPPWLFENYSEKGEEKNATSHYRCMPTKEISAMPVGHLAMKDCWLLLWATHPMMRQAYDVVEAWGFKEVTSGVWSKRRADKPGKPGVLAFGTGYVLRSASEPFIIAKVGSPPTFSKSIRSVIEAPRTRNHSEKPLAAYETCERLFGNVPRLSLFDRKSRPGWDMWGDQSGLFDTTEPVSTRQIRTQQKRADAEKRVAIEPTPSLDLFA